MERLFKREKPQAVCDLEDEMKRFVGNLNPGEKKLIAQAEGDDVLRIYHMGAEKKVRPGIFAREIETGNEYVFIEFKLDNISYHLTGAVDISSGEFNLKGLQKYHDSRYRTIPMHEEIVRHTALLVSVID